MDQPTLQFYQDNAQELAQRYNAADGGISDYFSRAFVSGLKILDVGCGSGRDLARLIEAGFDAYGVDNCEAFLVQAVASFPQLSDRVFRDELPDLAGIADNSYDGVVCSAVLMHLPKEDLFNSIYALRRVLKASGSLLVSIPEADETMVDNRDDAGRLFNGLTAEELQLGLERLGFRLIERSVNDDSLGRGHRTWVTQWFRLENGDGSRSLDRIEAVLNRDKKVATYKPALFRALSELAQTNYHVATWHHGGKVSLPLREISLKWILYYWPILEADVLIPQIQGEHRSGKPLAFRGLLNELIAFYRNLGGLSAFVVDFKANRLAPEPEKIFKQLVRKLDSTIKEGPVKHSGGFGSDQQVFAYDKTSKEILMPADLWRELSIMGAWVSDSTVLRWAELTARLADGQLKVSQVMDALLTTVDPVRDVEAARRYYQQLLGKECVWSGQAIDQKFVVDHALPFAHWRNNDLWNLLPADAKINGAKSDKLPTQDLLKSRRDCVIHYWQALDKCEPVRFAYEAEKFIGKSAFSPKNWENALFSGFQEAVELTARQRGLARWQPTAKQSAGQVKCAMKTTKKTAEKGRERSILPSFGSENPHGESVEFVDVLAEPERCFVSALPLVGQMAAGEPFRGFDLDDLSEASADLSWLAVPKRFCNRKSFIIQVVGDSMEPTIKKGENLVCEYHRHRQPGNKPVIMADFHALSSGVDAVKRIKEMPDHWLFLSDNPAYGPIRVEKEQGGEYPILGVVVYALGSLREQ